MVNALEQLWQLQELDRKSEELKKKLNSLSALHHIKELKASLSALGDREARLKEDLQQLQRELRRTELDVTELDGDLAQTKQALYGGEVTDYRELVQLQKNAHVLASKLDKKEEVAISLMEKIESVERDLNELQSVIADKNAELRTLEVEAVDTLAALEEQLRQLVSRRNKVRQLIDAQLLAEYHSRHKALRGTLVSMVGEDRICQGCHVRVPQHLWQRVKRGETVRCDRCGRFLLTSM